MIADTTIANLIDPEHKQPWWQVEVDVCPLCGGLDTSDYDSYGHFCSDCGDYEYTDDEWKTAPMDRYCGPDFNDLITLESYCPKPYCITCIGSSYVMTNEHVGASASNLKELYTEYIKACL